MWPTPFQNVYYSGSVISSLKGTTLLYCKLDLRWLAADYAHTLAVIDTFFFYILLLLLAGAQQSALWATKTRRKPPVALAIYPKKIYFTKRSNVELIHFSNLSDNTSNNVVIILLKNAIFLTYLLNRLIIIIKYNSKMIFVCL